MKSVAAMMVAMTVPCAFAAVQPVVDTDEVFPAAYTEDYELDGNLDKPVWKTAKVLPQNMYRLGKPLPYKDEIRVLWSKTALYIGATMWQDVSKALFKWDQRDMPTWIDDNLELFLFIPLEDGRNGLFQFVVNPLGTVADLLDGNVVWSNDGIETVAKLLQLSNAKLSIVFKRDGNSIDSRLLQKAKAESPISVKESGKMTKVRLLNP